MAFISFKSGFSLVELIVAIAIMGILLAVGSINFSSWQRKYAIEAQVQEMATDLNDLRVAAILKKRGHSVELKPTSYVFRIYSSETDFSKGNGTIVLTKQPKYRVTTLTGADIDAFVKIDERGYVSGVTLPSLAIGLATTTDVTQNCLVMSITRVNTGKLNGGNCEFR